MPAVIAIAIAPQKATRSVALPTGAPPAFAPIAPSIARNTKDAAETPTIMGGPKGDSRLAEVATQTDEGAHGARTLADRLRR